MNCSSFFLSDILPTFIMIISILHSTICFNRPKKFLLSTRGRGVELATILSLATDGAGVEGLGLLSCLTQFVKA